VEALLHPGFSEFGASGRRWGRTEIIAALAAEQPGGEEPLVTATEMVGTRLAELAVGAALVLAHEPDRPRGVPCASRPDRNPLTRQHRKLHHRPRFRRPRDRRVPTPFTLAASRHKEDDDG
jgi:hypothetical protein